MARALKDLINKKEKIQRWLIENLIGIGQLAILYAPKDHHKTGMALKIAMEIITGGKDLGASQSGKVLIYALDRDWAGEMEVRAMALANASYQDHLELIGSNLLFDYKEDVSEYETEFNLVNDNYWFDERGDYYENDRGEITEYVPCTLTWQDCGFFDYDEDIRLIIIDTLSKAIVGHGINDDIVIRKAINNIKKIIEGSENRISILLIHHTGKDARKGMMGTSLLSNDISNVLKIRKNKKGYELVREKHKSSHKNKSIPFKVRETVVKYQGDLHESIYIDIGKQIDDLESEIIKLSQEGLNKGNIRDNTYKTHGQHYNSKKSFNVVFGRKWNSLLKHGFLGSGQQDNN